MGDARNTLRHLLFLSPFTQLLDDGEKILGKYWGKYRIVLRYKLTLSSFLLLLSPFCFSSLVGLLGDRIQWDSGGGGAEFEGLIRWLLSYL